MTRPFKMIAGLLATTSAAGLVVATFPQPSLAGQKYSYDPVLVQRYNSGCVKKLTSKGKAPAQAKQMCSCSMSNMQSQLTEGQAISLLIQSQFSLSKDPNTGLPTSLSPYFVGCKA
ncbi:MAG: hypothetical protein HC851_17855 [Acaryochloris sp. RU_4_1]|nr:hypothetical protein [Acaryochloris sp. SU_5_25]NJM67401.1 hypothetical protein [Acaryochloris sp. RU_4_1]NJR62304.1 hypothetical protein [Cyanobacteria bacterium CRU_2_1]